MAFWIVFLFIWFSAVNLLPLQERMNYTHLSCRIRSVTLTKSDWVHYYQDCGMASSITANPQRGGERYHMSEYEWWFSISWNVPALNIYWTQKLFDCVKPAEARSWPSIMNSVSRTPFPISVYDKAHGTEGIKCSTVWHVRILIQASLSDIYGT